MKVVNFVEFYICFEEAVKNIGNMAVDSLRLWCIDVY
jgi:hypothetical protein